MSCATTRPVPTEGTVPASEEAQQIEPEQEKRGEQAIAPKAFPAVPPPDAAAAQVPRGYRVEVAVRDLIYPTSVDFDDAGNMYIAESGHSYGDPVAQARVFRVSQSGTFTIVADQLTGPITDILWHDGVLYIAEFGKVSALSRDAMLQDLVTDLPASWDHQNNQLTMGPDGKLYFGMGNVTNSGVVGLDNIYPFLWLLYYPDLHDIPPYDLELEDVTYTTPDALTVLVRQGELVSFGAAAKHLLSPSEPLLVKTGAFQPFGKSADKIKGQTKSNGTVLRMNLDGSGLEVYAWGFRNPFGLSWSPDGKLYAADNGYDERGSRPIANAPDPIWLVREGAFYGFPDYVAGEPITDPRFKSTRGLAPSFLMKNHPPVEKPFAVRPPHSGVTKIDFSRSASFGFEGQMFLGEVGSGAPINAPGVVRAGYQVSRIDMETGETAPFFHARDDALGQPPYEYVATAGPKRPVGVRFSPDGSTLYVVDFGALATFPAGGGPLGRPFPGSGTIWRITREGRKPYGPPANLSPAPSHAGREAEKKR